jgi:hypothetical protein
MSKATIKGDIKTLYAYYRLSDFEMTNISLVDKTLNETVAFEGHMNWSFNRCIFDAPFSFGVEGDRLEGDLRGNPDEEPFPPYGSNGVVFDGCIFNTNFNIEDNCVVLLKDCKFNNSDPVIFKKNTRVEFIGCEFFGPVELDYFCEVKFRDCSFDGLEYAINAKNHCKLFLDETTATGISNYFLSVENDCHVDVSSQEAASYETSSNSVFKGKDHCTIRLYGLGTVKSDVGPTLSVDEDSKLEVREVELIQSSQGHAVSVTDNSEGYFKEIPKVESTQGDAFYANKSVLRFRSVEEITSVQKHAIEAFDSTVYGMDLGTLNSVQTSAIYGYFSSFNLAKGDVILSNTSEAISLNEESNSTIRDFARIEGTTTGIILTNSAQLFVQRITDAIQGVSDYGCSLVKGILRVADCPLIEGAKTAIKSSGDSRVQTKNVTLIEGKEEAGVHLEDTVYDIQTSTDIIGLETGCYLGNCRGVITDVDLILGDEANGFVIDSVSGPTEITRVKRIECQAQGARIITGDNGQVQINEVEEILSHFGNAVEIDVGENSSLDLYDVEKITSVEQAGIVGAVTGRFTLTKSEHISSQNNQIVVITGDGINSFVRFSDIALCSTVDSPESPFFVSTVSTIELERIAEIKTITTEASVVELQGIGVDYGSIKVLNCAKVSAEECSNVVFTHNALLTDIVGTDEECQILGKTVKFAGLSAKDTNLYVSNYDKISVEEEGHAIDLEVLNARGVEMRVYAIREIIGAADGIHYEGSGTLKLTELPKIEGGSNDTNVVYLFGTPFTTVEMHSIATVTGKGKFVAKNTVGKFYGCVINAPVTQEGSRLEFYNTPVTLNGADNNFTADSTSSVYFFNSAVAGGRLDVAGTVTGDVSSFPQGKIAGAALLNSCAITDYWEINGAIIANSVETSNILNITGGIGTAALLNGYKATGSEGVEIGDFCGVILNSAEFADGAIAVNNTAALIANSLTAAASRINGLGQVGILLNRFEIDDFELFTSSGVIMNAGSITQAVSITAANALLFNKVSCASNFICTSGNNSLLFNLVNMGILQASSSTILAANLQASQLAVASNGAVNLSGGSIGAAISIPSAVSFLSVGASIPGLTGQGNALVVTTGSVAEPANAGIVIRGSGSSAQVYIKTPQTSELFGNLNTGILRRATSGKIIDDSTDITHSASGDIYQDAGGDIIRNADGDIVDIATNLDRQGSGTITDTASAIVHVPPV